MLFAIGVAVAIVVDPPAVPLAQILELHVQVLARFEPSIAAPRMLETVCEVLVAVRLVDEQVVDPGLLEA